MLTWLHVSYVLRSMTGRNYFAHECPRRQSYVSVKVAARTKTLLALSNSFICAYVPCSPHLPRCALLIAVSLATKSSWPTETPKASAPSWGKIVDLGKQRRWRLLQRLRGESGPFGRVNPFALARRSYTMNYAPVFQDARTPGGCVSFLTVRTKENIGEW